MLEKYHPLWINLHFNHPNEITPEVSRAVDKLTRAGLPGRQPERAARRRQRLRPHPARARPQAGREPDPAVLPVPVRPGRGLRPLPDAGRQGPRDHGGPARPHLGLRGADLRDRRARRRRQDPGHAQLPDQLLATTRSCCATTRATSRPTRSPRRTSARHGGLRVLPARAPGARPVRRPRPARGRADVDRAEGLRTRSTPAATPRRTGSRTRRSGCRSASARSRAARARRCRVLEAGDVAGIGDRRPTHRLRSGRGATAARGRADRVRPRRAALARRPASPARPRRRSLR